MARVNSLYVYIATNESRLTMVFINTTDSLGALLYHMTQNLTGSVFLTLLTLTGLIMMIAFAFRFPMEVSLILVLPLHLVATAYTAEYYAVLASIILYLVVIVTKYIVRL